MKNAKARVGTSMIYIIILYMCVCGQTTASVISTVVLLEIIWDVVYSVWIFLIPSADIHTQ